MRYDLRGQHPAVRFLFAEMDMQLRTHDSVSTQAGLSRAWLSMVGRRGVTPNVGNLEAALNVLGFTLKVAPLER